MALPSLLLLARLTLAATPDLGPLYGQLGIGALIAVPFSGISLLMWRAYQASLLKVEALQMARVTDAKEAVERERQLADKLAPLLAEAARILSTAPDRFDKALETAQSATKTSEVDRLLRSLEDTVASISRERRPGP